MARRPISNDTPEARKERDANSRAKAEKDREDKFFRMGQSVYNRVTGIVSQYVPKPGAYILDNLLTMQIREYGFNEFTKSLYFANDSYLMDEATKLAVCDSDDIRHNRHKTPYYALVKIFEGCIFDLKMELKYTDVAETMEDDDEWYE